MNSYLRPERVIPFAAGLVISVVINRLTGWWLNSGRAAGTMLVAEFVAAFVLAVWKSRGRKERIISWWAGGLAGMALFLFATGPGTIWPLALVVAAIVTAAPILAGVAVASMLRTQQ
jgi:hypothetical protein